MNVQTCYVGSMSSARGACRAGTYRKRVAGRRCRAGVPISAYFRGVHVGDMHRTLFVPREGKRT